MHFAVEEDVISLREAVATYFRKACTPEFVASVWSADSPKLPRSMWDELAEMGVLGLQVPTTAGGLGFGAVAGCGVLIEAGRVAAPLPLIETMAVALPVLVDAGDPLSLVKEVMSGRVLIAVESGAGVTPADAEWFIANDPPALFPLAGVRLERLRSVDANRDLAGVELSDSGLSLKPRDVALAERAALAAAAMLIGLGRGMLSMSVGHVTARQQFGRPIGAFQAVKHKLADALMKLEFAEPTVWAAAWEVDHLAENRSRSVALAKAMASGAALEVARASLQVHGAMGYTDDYPLHMWMKRAWSLAASFGTARAQRSRIADMIGL